MHPSPVLSGRRLPFARCVFACVLLMAAPAGAATSTTGRRPSPPIPSRAGSTTTLRANRLVTTVGATSSTRKGTATTIALRTGSTTTVRGGSTTTVRGGSTTSTSSTSSTTTTIPPDLKTEIELAIVDGQRAAAPGLKVTRATCPAVLKVLRSQAKAGTYECTVVIEGVTAPYTVVVTRPEKGRTGTYALSPAKAIIDVSKVIAGIREELDPSERATAKISCGKAKVIVAAPGVQIVCSTTTGTLTMPVRYTVKDLDGTIALVTE